MIAERSLWSLIEARAASTPDALCTNDEHGATLTFGELRERSERAAAGLQELGVHAGTCVAWQLPTWWESMVLVGALARLGAVQVPMLPIYREREVGFILRQTTPELIVVPSHWRGFDYGELADRLTRPAAGSTATACRVLRCDRDLPDGDPASLLPAPGPGLPDLVRWIFYTSGTTADPKGAKHSDATLAAGSAAVAHAFRFTESDRFPILFPFTHVGGIGMLFIQLMSGAGSIALEQFDAERDLPLLAAQGMTLAAGGTPIALVFLAAQRRRPDVPLFPDLRGVITGAAPKSVTLHEELRDELGGSGALSCYGLTEVPFLSANDASDTDAQRATTEGRALAGAEVRVVADDGSVRGPGELGELQARGPQVCLGYVDSTLDADAFDDDGYFRTGDLGALDGDGFVSVLGRIKDVIIRKGEKISALEVESILAAHPTIADVAVVGLPDPVTGERCCAIVVASDPSGSLGVAEIAVICRAAGLSRQKTPERVEQVAELPRNASGKVLKYQLRERYVDEAPRSD